MNIENMDVNEEMEINNTCALKQETLHEKVKSENEENSDDIAPGVGDLITYEIHVNSSVQFNCYSCGDTFCEKNKLEEHIRTCNCNAEKDFFVKSSDTKIESEFNKSDDKVSEIDKQLAHSEEASYVCNECNISFTQLSDFEDHKVHSHMILKPFSCGFTSRRVRRNKNINKKSFDCDQCDKTFKRRKNLKEHINTHLGLKPYCCGKCSKSFVRLTTLKEHMNTHLSIKPFGCDKCEKSFAQLGQLKDHIKIHLGLKQYHCLICNKSFTRSSELNRHKLIHLEVKPYSCTQCSKSFARISQLKAHKHSRTQLNPLINPLGNQQGLSDTIDSELLQNSNSSDTPTIPLN